MTDAKDKIIKLLETANEMQLKILLEELKKLVKTWVFLIVVFLPIRENLIDLIF